VQSAMVGSYFLVGNGRGVVGLSLVITDVSRGSGMRW